MTEYKVPSLTEIYKAKRKNKNKNLNKKYFFKGVFILKNLPHPADCLFNFLPSQKEQPDSRTVHTLTHFTYFIIGLFIYLWCDVAAHLTLDDCTVIVLNAFCCRFCIMVFL